MSSVSSMALESNDEGSLDRCSRDDVQECRLDIAGDERGTARLGLLRRTFGLGREAMRPGALEAAMEGAEGATVMVYSSPSERRSGAFCQSLEIVPRKPRIEWFSR